MEQKELLEFLQFFTHNKNLTRAQRKKLDVLLARDYMQNDVSPEIESELLDNKSNTVLKPISVIDTASFFALFNKPMGLKYLTHDFDSISDGRPLTIDDLCVQVRNILKETKSIPQSLWGLINSYLEGKKTWIDTFNVSHKSFINNPEWVKWSTQTKMHPINNPLFEKEIMAFRSTVRIVPQSLNKICARARENLRLSVVEENLEKADFYTNTFVLYTVIKRILTMMNRRVEKAPNVNISYKRKTDEQGRLLRQIIITQKDSFPEKSIQEVEERMIKYPEAGDLGFIRKFLNGYCLWQIESIWDDKPCRWNILKTEEMPEFEEIERHSIVGFSHILTFYLL